ncbi:MULTISPECIES: long-chain-fatty-acid--CoA ligase [Kocuria]|uniref:Long-chain fatty acid--CoA ligase n=1 Tax=Kocuria subflava TaxID=1736139 RepID=A0A846U7U2_9MICC|nr:long-chain fatty acid--CoA ligase [Kocuria sp. CPCC 104605]NKE09666.1 long-chain fatty acid--CoA ligase [Kocuria subflava]
MTNLATLLTTSAGTHADRVMVKLDDAQLTYAQVHHLSACFAGQLRRAGVSDGDRVAIILPNVPHVPVIYNAILRLGAIVVPLNPLLTEREVAYHLEDSQAVAVVVWEAMAVTAEAAAGDRTVITLEAGSLQGMGEQEPAQDVADKDEDDVAVLLYTSGTTGRPKGAMLTHRNMRTNAELVVELFSITPEDVLFGGLPFFHVFGQTVAMNAVAAAGASVTLLGRFEPVKAVDVLKRDAVTLVAAVPSMHIAMVQEAVKRKAEEFPHIRGLISGGSPLPVEVLRRAEKVFDAVVLEGYGLSETSPVVCFNQFGGPRAAGSIGTPVRGADLRVVDAMGEEVPYGEVGEIAISGQYVMAGYWRKEEATAQAIRDGWLQSGDLGRQDDDGLFYIVDRMKDMIIRGGYNVYPREVEEVIFEFQGVSECAVIGVPDDRLGQEVAAVVAFVEQPEDPGAVITQLDEHVRAQLANYKVPRVWQIVEALPKGPTGKILKRTIEVGEDAVRTGSNA